MKLASCNSQVLSLTVITKDHNHILPRTSISKLLEIFLFQWRSTKSSRCWFLPITSQTFHHRGPNPKHSANLYQTSRVRRPLPYLTQESTVLTSLQLYFRGRHFLRYALDCTALVQISLWLPSLAEATLQSDCHHISNPLQKMEEMWEGWDGLQV